MASTDTSAVEIDDLNVSFATDGGDVHAVRGVTLDVRRAEVLAIVGGTRNRSPTASSVWTKNRCVFTARARDVG